MRISDGSSDVCSSDLQLLDGTGYVPRRDASGAGIIVKGEQHAQAAPRPVAPPPPPPPAPAEPETTELQAVQVTGSRIPRAQIEGHSSIRVITAEQISASCFTNMTGVRRSMTQHNDATQYPTSEQQPSDLQSLISLSYAVLILNTTKENI